METKVYPNFLYHYTKIESLAHILSTRKIRLSPITTMDDKLEGICQDLQHCRKYAYASSWTDIERENIPFWSMYAGQMSGVRIKLKHDMLIEHPIIFDETRVKGVAGINYNLSIINQNSSFGDNYWVLPFPKGNFLKKVEYKSLQELKSMETISLKEDGNTIINIQWGNYKLDDWAFQSEWRFWAFAMPIDYNHEHAFEDSLDMMVKGEDINLEYLYADIKPDAFEQMEILLGPKTTDADKIIIESLLREHNPNALKSLDKSKLQIK